MNKDLPMFADRPGLEKPIALHPVLWFLGFTARSIGRRVWKVFSEPGRGALTWLPAGG
jgi:hypothetical protein